MKKNIMSFVMITVIIFLMVSIGYSENKTKKQLSVSEKSSSDWVEYDWNNDGNVRLYNKVSIKHMTKNIVQVWSKVVYSDEGREKKIQNYRERGLSTKGYDKVSDTLFLWEIDCTNKKYRSLSIIDYDNNGVILISDSNDETKWENIVPDTRMETLQKKVCVTPKESSKKK